MVRAADREASEAQLLYAAASAEVARCFEQYGPVPQFWASECTPFAAGFLNFKKAKDAAAQRGQEAIEGLRTAQQARADLSVKYSACKTAAGKSGSGGGDTPLPPGVIMGGTITVPPQPPKLPPTVISPPQNPPPKPLPPTTVTPPQPATPLTAAGGAPSTPAGGAPMCFYGATGVIESYSLPSDHTRHPASASDPGPCPPHHDPSNAPLPPVSSGALGAALGHQDVLPVTPLPRVLLDPLPPPDITTYGGAQAANDPHVNVYTPPTHRPAHHPPTHTPPPSTTWQRHAAVTPHVNIHNPPLHNGSSRTTTSPQKFKRHVNVHNGAAYQRSMGGTFRQQARVSRFMPMRTSHSSFRNAFSRPQRRH
jgi:hypothetical protein